MLMLQFFVLLLIAGCTAATTTAGALHSLSNVSFRSYVLVDGIMTDLSDAISNDAPPGEDTSDNQIIEEEVQQFISTSTYKDSLSYKAQLPCSIGSIIHGTSAECERQVDLDKALIKSIKQMKLNLISSVVSRDLLDEAEYIQKINTRRLASGDFKELNNVLRGLVLGIKDQSISTKIWPSTLKITLSNLRCGGLSLQDFTVKSRKNNENKKVLVAVTLNGLSVMCSCNYNYKWGWFSGEGSLSAGGGSSSINTQVAFHSQNFKTHPPTKSEILGCTASIDIDTLNMRGGIVASIASWFKGLIKSKVKEALNPVLCEQFEGMGNILLSTAMNDLAEEIKKYLPDGELNQHMFKANRLALEHSLSEKESEKLISFRPNLNKYGHSKQSNPNTFVSSVLQKGLDIVDDMLGGTFESNIPNMKTKDLGINNLIREMFPSRKKTPTTPERKAGTISLNLEKFGTSMPIYDASDPLTHTTLTVRNITLNGLDTFQTFRPLSLIGDYTFQHEISLNGPLEIKVHLKLNIKPTSRPFDGATSIVAKHDNKEVSEDIMLNFKFSKLDLRATSFIGIVASSFFRLKLGSVYNNPLPCTIHTIVRAELTSALASIGDIDEPILKGFLSTGLDKIFAQFIQVLFLMFEDTILLSLPSVVSSTVRQKINQMVTTYLDELRENVILGKYRPVLQEQKENTHLCRDPEILPNSNVFFNYQTSPFWKELNKLLKYIDDATVNNLIRNFTTAQSGTSGTLIIPMQKISSGFFGTNDASETMNEIVVREKDVNKKEKLPGTIDIDAMFGTVTFNSKNPVISNIDTIHNLMLLEPSSPYELNNSIAIGAKEKPLTGSLNFFIGTKGGEISMHNNFTLTAGIFELDLFAKLFAKVDAGKMNHLELQELPSMDCWVSTLKEFSLPNVSMSIGSVFLNLKCHKCTSPGLIELETSMKTVKAQNELTYAINKLFNFSTKILQSDNTSKVINQYIKGAGKRCYDWVHNTTTADELLNTNGAFNEVFTNDQGVEMDWMIIGTFLFFVSILAGICFCYQRKNKDKKKLVNDRQKTSTNDKDDLTSSPLISNSTALCNSPIIPLAARILIPVLLFCNAVFFFSGHIGLGAQVQISLIIAGEQVIIPDFFTFSLAKSTYDMWVAGARALAIVICVFSGLWPYTKIFISYFLWFASPKTYTPAARGSALMRLDSLGKWSMIDIFVLVLSMIGFHLNIVSPALALLPENFYVVEVKVIPMWGLYSNIIAQVLSQIISHVIIYYHRNDVTASSLIEPPKSKSMTLSSALTECGNSLDVLKIKKAMKKPRFTVRTRRRASTWINATENIVGPRKVLISHKEALRKHIYDVDRHLEPMRIQITQCGQWLIILLIFIGIFCLFWGASQASFSMETSGLAGLAIDLGKKGGSETHFSIYDVFIEIWNQAEINDFSSIVGIRGIALLFFICGMIIPFLELLGIFVLWVVPLSLKHQKKLYILNEALSAWQYLEVYLIAVAVGTLQISQIAGFMIGDACDGFTSTFQTLSEIEVIETKYDHCFSLDSKIEKGSFILLACAFVLNFLVQLVNRAATAAMEDRENRIRGLPIISTDNESKQSKYHRKFLMTVCCFRYVKEEDDDKYTDEEKDSDVENPIKNFTDRKRLRSRSRSRSRSHSRSRSRSSRSRSRSTYTPAPQENGLKAHWEEHYTEQNEIFFWNSVTGESTWERPAAPKPLQPNWEEVKVDKGKYIGEVYYWNNQTGETTWERPIIVVLPPPPPPRTTTRILQGKNCKPFKRISSGELQVIDETIDDE